MNYTLHQLQVFLKVAEKQSVTKASEELFLTQPAVSIQLKNFQEQFSIPLTEVVGRRLFVTEFGSEIAAAAQKILDEVETINYKTLAYQGMLFGKLKISVVSTGKYVIPYFLSGFISDNDGVELLMDVTNKMKVVDSLKENKVDFALVSVLPTDLEIDRIELMENKLYFVGGTTLRTGKKISKRKMFETYPLIYREEGSATRNAMENFVIENKFPVRKKIELTSNEAVKQAVIAGLGYSIMPLIGIKNALRNKDLEIIEVKGLPLRTTWNLIWLKAKKHGPAAKAFKEYISAKKDAIMAAHFDWFEEVDSQTY